MKVLRKITVTTIAVGLMAGASAMAGTYFTPTIDGNGSEWSGVPILLNDPSGDAGTLADVNTVQIANDDNFLYLRITYHAAVNPQTGSLFLAIDTDSNTATGFNIFGLGLVGSEAGWQNNFPFDQRGGFNSGGINGGVPAIELYNNSVTEQEYAISRAATYASDNAAVFGSSFKLLVWTDNPGFETAGAIPYDFAAIPEPSTVALVALGLVGAGLLRRRS